MARVGGGGMTLSQIDKLLAGHHGSVVAVSRLCDAAPAWRRKISLARIFGAWLSSAKRPYAERLVRPTEIIVESAWARISLSCGVA